MSENSQSNPNPNNINNINNANNIPSPNDEKYKKFFYNTENLENIYNILKGEEKQLKKETVKKLIQDFEGVEYDEIKEENKNTSNMFHQLSSLPHLKIKIPRPIVVTKLKRIIFLNWMKNSAMGNIYHLKNFAIYLKIYMNHPRIQIKYFLKDFDIWIKTSKKYIYNFFNILLI